MVAQKLAGGEETPQEAIQAAAACLLHLKEDWIYPYYRDTLLCLGLQMSPQNILRGLRQFEGMKKNTQNS